MSKHVLKGGTSGANPMLRKVVSITRAPGRAGWEPDPPGAPRSCPVGPLPEDAAQAKVRPPGEPACRHGAGRPGTGRTSRHGQDGPARAGRPRGRRAQGLDRLGRGRSQRAEDGCRRARSSARRGDGSSPRTRGVRVTSGLHRSSPLAWLHDHWSLTLLEPTAAFGWAARAEPTFIL